MTRNVNLSLQSKKRKLRIKYLTESKAQQKNVLSN